MAYDTWHVRLTGWIRIDPTRMVGTSLGRCLASRLRAGRRSTRIPSRCPPVRKRPVRFQYGGLAQVAGSPSVRAKGPPQRSSSGLSRVEWSAGWPLV